MPQSAPSAAVSDDTRQKKRVRISEEGTDLEGQSNTTHSQKYWFEDGNIILRIEDTLFRVHRGILSRHSTVFSDMFALPQPGTSEGENVVEGCHVVDLPGDKVQDWERVFAILYDFDTAYKKQGEFPIAILASMLRLGRKYQFDGIFYESMERIHEVVPTTLARWNGVPKVFSGANNCGRAYRLLEILLEIGNQALLPALYYCCSAYLDTTSIFLLCRAISVGDASILAEKLITGRERLSVASTQVLLGWAVQPEPWLEPAGPGNAGNGKRACRIPTCRPAKQAHLQRSLATRPFPSLALMTGSAVVRTLPIEKMCIGCVQEISAIHDKHREAMWEKLPSFFDLPAWKDLKDL